MKKLSTILSTIIFSLLAISPAFAICETSDNFWNTLQNANYQFTYTLNNGATQTAGASDGTLITANNVKAYGDLTTYFNLDHLWKYINLTGIITITSTVPNQLSNEFIINNMSSPTLLYQLDNGGFVEWGTCDFTSMTLNNLSEFVVNSTTGTDRYNQQNINYSVKCYAGENAPSTRIQALRFHLWKNQYNSSTSMNANISIVHHLASDYQTYQGEYNNELCRIQELLQGISTGGGSGTTSQDIENQTQQIIQNDNNNTQQIIDNQNDIYIKEECEEQSCSNIFHPTNFIMCTNANTCSYGDSFIKLNKTNSNTTAFILGGNNNGTLQSNSTYYYDIECSSDKVTDIILNAHANGPHLSCGNGSFSTNSMGELYVNRFDITTSESIQDLQLNIYISEISGSYCAYGSTIEECTGSNRLDNINDSITEIGSDLTDTNTDDVDDELEEFFEQDIEDFGLSDFTDTISSYVLGVANSSCSPIHLQFPYLQNKYIDLPCLTPIYQQKFGLIYDLYALIMRGIISYVCVIEFYKIIHDLLNPDDNKVQMLEL